MRLIEIRVGNVLNTLQRIRADCMHTCANVIILYLAAAEINTNCSHEAYLTFSFPLSPFPGHFPFFARMRAEFTVFIVSFQLSVCPSVWGCIVGSALLPVANFKHISYRRLTLSAHICCLLHVAYCLLPAATVSMLPVGC